MKVRIFIFVLVFFCFSGDSVANVNFSQNIFPPLNEEILVRCEDICLALEEVNDGFDMDEYIFVVSQGSYNDFDVLAEKYQGIMERSKEGGDALGELFYQIYFLNLKILQIEKFPEEYPDQNQKNKNRASFKNQLDEANEKIEKEYYFPCYGDE